MLWENKHRKINENKRYEMHALKFYTFIRDIH